MTAIAGVCIGASASSTPPPPPTGLDNQTVTSGVSGTSTVGTRKTGFTSGGLGSISDGTSNLYAGAAITELSWYQNGGFPDDLITLKITGSLANSGWTQMAVDSSTYSRSSATYSTSGGFTSWQWFNPGGQPFGGSGSVHNVVFS